MQTININLKPTTVKTVILIIFLFLTISSRQARSETENVIRLTLKECLALAIKNNIDISIERIKPLQADTDVSSALSEFDPVFSLSGSGKMSRDQSTSSLVASESEGYEISAGIGSKLVSGTELNINLKSGRALSNSSFQGLSPKYSTAFNFGFTQHLLKDFGTDINKSRIVIANNSRLESHILFKDMVIKTLAQVQNIYWDLVLAIEDNKVKQETLDLAKQFEERVRIQVKVGVLAPLEITQAKAEVAAREEDIIIAANIVRDMEDNLRRLINIGMDSWDRTIIPMDTPSIKKLKLNIEEELNEALVNRPDYQLFQTNIKSSQIDLLYKKNQLYPALDLSGSFQLGGVSGEATTDSTADSAIGNYWKSFENTGSGKYYNWQVGLTLSMPLGNRRAKSAHLTSKLEVEKRKKILKNLEQQITLDVREAVRRIDTALKRIDATQASRELAYEKLDAEEKKFKVGLSTSFNVLEYQRDLSVAKSRELLAIADLNKSQINLTVAKGTLLEKNNIELD